MDFYITLFVVMALTIVFMSVYIVYLEEKLKRQSRLLNVNVQISDLEMFREYNKLTKRIIDDKRIPREVKSKYYIEWEKIEKKYKDD